MTRPLPQCEHRPLSQRRARAAIQPRREDGTDRRPPARRCAASRQEGFITIWLLGLCVALLFLGGISLDLWRSFSARRAVASIADAAAIAGASGIDQARFDSANELVLDPDLARSLALDSFRSQTSRSGQDGATVTDEPRIDVAPDRITVTVSGKVDYTLLRIFLGSGSAGAFTVTVDATAAPYRSS